MAHFSVGVLTQFGTEEEVEALMAPYQENNMGDCPEEYLEFCDMDEFYRNQYETLQTTMYESEKGELYHPGDKILHPSGSELVLPEGWKEVEKPFKEIFPTLEVFMKEYYGVEPDPQKGIYGYWENPDAKWDWYEIGGRFENSIPHQDGTYHTTLPIKDIAWEPSEASLHYAERYWEINVEGKPLEDGEKEMDFLSMWKPQYYWEMYGTKEQYIRCGSSFSPYALLMENGEWIAQGTLRTFCLDDATANSIDQYQAFFETEIPQFKDYFLTIVDCHI